MRKRWEQRLGSVPARYLCVGRPALGKLEPAEGLHWTLSPTVCSFVPGGAPSKFTLERRPLFLRKQDIFSRGAQWSLREHGCKCPGPGSCWAGSRGGLARPGCRRTRGMHTSPGVSAPTSSWSFLLDTQLLRRQPLTGPLA